MKLRSPIVLTAILFTVMSNIECSTTSSMPDKSRQCESCVAVLRDIMNSPSEGFFIRVHAAEALALNGYPQGVEEVFIPQQKASPDYFIGATRVLARVYKNTPAKYEEAQNLIIDRFLHAEVMHHRLVAVESLGKLGYNKPLPQIVDSAKNAKATGFKAMSRWVLANSGKAEDEAYLAELLASTEPTEYRGASYAIRFMHKIRPETYKQLESLANRVPKSPERVYIYSSLFVHTPQDKVAKIKPELLSYLKNGEVFERYEAAEGLSLNGLPSDIPALEEALKDVNMDVRVAAANAIIKIKKRN